jgi:D-inositol-3-phosphate glycosyltransferase
MRIAMVSEHASPLAALGGVDAGGQNVFVAALATVLGRHGSRVTVHTRRDNPETPAAVWLNRGARESITSVSRQGFALGAAAMRQ